MSNCCFFSAEIDFENSAERAKFFKKIDNDIKNIDKYEGLFIGSEERYLLDPAIRCATDKDNVVYLNGWVAWALEHNEMIEVTDYFKTIAKIKKIDIEYEELMCDIIGKYVFENNVITDYYLTSKQIADVYYKHPYSKDENDGNDEMLEDYHKKLYEELKNNPTVFVVRSAK